MTADGAAHRRSMLETSLMFRGINRRIREVGERLRAPEAEFFCECGSVDCTERINLTLAEYEAMRSPRGRFVVAPGHDGVALSLDDAGRAVTPRAVSRA